MDGKTLKRIRRLFLLSQSEAAKEIGGFSKRSWNNWEANTFSVPEKVQEQLMSLLKKRKELIEYLRDKDLVIYYGNKDVYFVDGLLDLRFKQSLALTLHFDWGVPLVDFDWEDYKSWLTTNRKTDTEDNRLLWASGKKD